jgi:hypothetical protein
MTTAKMQKQAKENLANRRDMQIRQTKDFIVGLLRTRAHLNEVEWRRDMMSTLRSPESRSMVGRSGLEL